MSDNWTGIVDVPAALAEMKKQLDYPQPSDSTEMPEIFSEIIDWLRHGVEWTDESSAEQASNFAIEMEDAAADRERLANELTAMTSRYEAMRLERDEARIDAAHWTDMASQADMCLRNAVDAERAGCISDILDCAGHVLSYKVANEIAGAIRARAAKDGANG